MWLDPFRPYGFRRRPLNLVSRRSSLHNDQWLRRNVFIKALLYLHKIDFPRHRKGTEAKGPFPLSRSSFSLRARGTKVLSPMVHLNICAIINDLTILVLSPSPHGFFCSTAQFTTIHSHAINWKSVRGYERLVLNMIIVMMVYGTNHIWAW